MDDDDAKHLLLQIRRMVAEPYPFKEGDAVDPRYTMTFGMIVAICTEALQAKAQNRPVRLVQFTQDEQKRLALILALKVAANKYYEDAWALSGPNGVNPDPASHDALMRLGDQVREIGRELGDPMD